MASGKLTPRQKMINMMYLVLTALLALNVSKEILQAFVVVNEGLERSNQTCALKTEGLYTAFDGQKNLDEERVRPYWDKAQAVRKNSISLYTYIDTLKKQLMRITEGLDKRTADTLSLAFVNGKDNYDIPTEIMIGQSEDGSRGVSRDLKFKMEEYKKFLEAIISPEDKGKVYFSLNTSDPKHSEENENWEMYNFYHSPLAAVITNLSHIQNDVKNAEGDAVEYLFGKIHEDDFPFDTVAARVIAPTNYVLLGDEYKADVFVAAFSKTKDPEVKVGDYDLANKKFTGAADSIKVEKGMGKYTMKTSREGIFKWGGEVTMVSKKGRKKTYPFVSEYIVAKPAAVVSPEMMNVFYMGLDNPVSVSVPGVANENVSVSINNGNITKLSNGKYVVKGVKQGKATISLTATLPGGEKRSMGAMEFRCKALPKPEASINGISGAGRMKKEILASIQGMLAQYAGVEFNATPTVKSFTLNAYSRGVFASASAKDKFFTREMTDLIKRLRTGDVVYFDDIKVVGPDLIAHDLPGIKITLN